MRHVVMLSGGLSSWVAARRVKAAMAPEDELVLLFADTIIEDNDLYRFLVEVAADLADRPILSVVDLADRALNLLPPGLLEQRKAQLTELRRDANARFPMLRWIADGRTPFEVFRDKRFLGNSRRDPCSKYLKRDLLDRWMGDNCDPASTIIYTGIGWWEEHRQVRLAGRKAEKGWRYEAPLCAPPLVTQPILEEMSVQAGIYIPRLYKLGFKHNNCGGGCVKAGIGQFAHLHKVLPKTFDYWERKEMQMRVMLQRDISMLTDRRGGERKPLPLYQLRKRLEGQAEPLDACEINDTRGCGCAVDDEEEVLA